MRVHWNAGVPHIHECPLHPWGTLAASVSFGGMRGFGPDITDNRGTPNAACFFRTDHDLTQKAAINAIVFVEPI